MEYRMKGLKQLAGQALMLTALAGLLGAGLVWGHGEGDGEVVTGASEAEESGGGSRLEQWLYEQRAYPQETIPTGAGERMMEQLARLEADTAALLEQVGQGAAQAVWAPLGPEPILFGQTFGSPRNNVSGRISALAIDPRFDGRSNRTVYLGGAQGGVWKSEDNGESWAPLTDGQGSQAVGALAIDPQSPETIYVGLGEGSRCSLCYYGSGLLKSTDGGKNWQPIAGPVSPVAPRIPVFTNAAFTRIAIDPATPSTIYATTTYGYTAHATSRAQQLGIGQVGLWKSTDGGSNWTNLDPGGTNGLFSAHDVVVDPLNPNIVYAGMRTIGIFRSDAKGAPGSWRRLVTGLPDLGNDPSGNNSTSPYRRVALAIGPPVAPATASTIYAAFAGGNDELLGIYRSVDNGNSWTSASIPQRPGQANYNLDLAVDPTDGQTLYYGTSANNSFSGGTLWRSRDGGLTWQDISVGQTGGGLHADTHRIAISRNNPAILFTGNDGGVWRTDNARAESLDWKQLNDSLNVTQFVSLAVHPTNPARVYGGTQDNGTNMFRGNLAWDHVADGDGGYVLVDQSDPRVVWHTYYNVNNTDGRAQIGPRVSTNSGGFGTWIGRGCFGCSTAQAGNFNPADRVAFYAPLAQHTGFTGSSGNVVYFGTYRLYRTANRGLSWSGLGASTDGFGADLTRGAGVITAIAANPQLDQSASPPGETVWVGTSDGNVQVSTNAGAGSSAVFSNVTRAPLPNRFVSDIAVDPGNVQQAVVVYSGFEANTPATPGHVFVTTNLGQTWVNISGNLPDVPVTSVALIPASPNTIYIGTDLGVFQTVDRGQNWLHLDNGMPRVATFALRYQAATNSLFAATHGRGIYRLTIPGTVTGVSAASYNGQAAAPESIMSAFGSDLATETGQASALPLPTRLAGSRVAVRDSLGTTRYAPLFYAGPGQINFLLPGGTAPGQARINVTTGIGEAAAGVIEIEPIAPALFSANASGTGVVAGFALQVLSNGSTATLPLAIWDEGLKRYVATPLETGGSPVYLVVFGSGLRNRSSLANVQATVGGIPCQVEYAGPQSSYVGLDQVNLLLPGNLTPLAGRGEVPIQLIVDGKSANPVTISVK